VLFPSRVDRAAPLQSRAIHFALASYFFFFYRGDLAIAPFPEGFPDGKGNRTFFSLGPPSPSDVRKRLCSSLPSFSPARRLASPLFSFSSPPPPAHGPSDVVPCALFPPLSFSFHDGRGVLILLSGRCVVAGENHLPPFAFFLLQPPTKPPPRWRRTSFRRAFDVVPQERPGVVSCRCFFQIRLLRRFSSSTALTAGGFQRFSLAFSPGKGDFFGKGRYFHPKWFGSKKINGHSVPPHLVTSSFFAVICFLNR